MHPGMKCRRALGILKFFPLDGLFCTQKGHSKHPTRDLLDSIVLCKQSVVVVRPQSQHQIMYAHIKERMPHNYEGLP
jgi:hypothetical protein